MATRISVKMSPTSSSTANLKSPTTLSRNDQILEDLPEHPPELLQGHHPRHVVATTDLEILLAGQVTHLAPSAASKVVSHPPFLPFWNKVPGSPSTLRSGPRGSRFGSTQTRPECAGTRRITTNPSSSMTCVKFALVQTQDMHVMTCKCLKSTKAD